LSTLFLLGGKQEAGDDANKCWKLTLHFRHICWRRHQVILHSLTKIMYSPLLPNNYLTIADNTDPKFD